MSTMLRKLAPAVVISLLTATSTIPQSKPTPLVRDDLQIQQIDSLLGRYAGDRFATSIAIAGDVNGDGWKDLLVGAPYDSSNGTSCGCVYVYFGGNKLAGEPDVILHGKRHFDSFGASVAAAGDFNGDGIDDFVVGAPTNRFVYPPIVDSVNDGIGKAFVFFGSPNVDTIPGLVLTNGAPTGLDGFPTMFGQSVSGVGDIDGDGFGDILVGAPYADLGSSAPETGAAYLYRGAEVADSIVDKKLGRSLAYFVSFGRTVAGLGDINSDGLPELAVARFHQVENDDPGAVTVFGDIMQADSFSTTLTSPVWHVRPDGFGNSIAHADINGDGYQDIIIGAPNDRPDSDAGDTLLPATTYVFAGATVLNTSPVATLTLSRPGTGFGSAAIGVGDLDGDGFDEFLVGAPGDTSSGGVNVGAVYLYHGSTSPDRMAWNSVHGSIVSGSFGGTLAGALDFDGDGKIEIIVGAPGNGVDGKLPGRVYVLKTDLITSVNGQAKQQPDQYRLYQNYPNPFNPSTTIQYTLAGTRGQGSGVSEVRIVIYDVLGREVATLVDGRVTPGTHEVRFNASKLASGVYFYRLTVGAYTATKAMLLVR